MVNYYWRITLTFRLRQSIDPAQEPSVMRLIRAEAAALQLAPMFWEWEYEQKYPERLKNLVARCCEPGDSSSLVGAISRLHMINYYPVHPRLYEFKGAEIHLTADAVEFRHIVDALWGDACFYCGRTPDGGRFGIGYLVPATYVVQDRVWNLVISCEDCSAAKGEQTPPDTFVEKLARRNLELLALIPRKRVGLGNRDIHEVNHFGPRLAEYVRGLIEGCRADGFGTWAGPERSAR
jgi:hypothetical protein